MELNKPIFIIGAPRSGTSILGRILECHPNCVHIKEPRLIWKYGNDAKSDILNIVDANPKVKAYIQKKFSEFIQKPEQRLLEKTPSNSLRLAFVYDIFPDAKFIHIIRNGYDSILSIKSYWNNFTGGISYDRIGSKETVLQQRMKEIHWTQIPYYAGEFLGRILSKVGWKSTVLWGPRLPAMKKLHKELELIELCAMQWRFCVELACQDGRKLPSNTYKEVKLEELSREILDEVLDFLELDNNGPVIEYFESNFNPGMSKGRTRKADEEELAKIKRFIEPTMLWLGYDA